MPDWLGLLFAILAWLVMGGFVLAVLYWLGDLIWTALHSRHQAAGDGPEPVGEPRTHP